MSLARSLAQAPKGRGHSCSIGILVATWPVEEAHTEDYRALLAALENPEWTSTAIAKVLEEDGRTVSFRHLQAHRRGDCTSANCPVPQIGLLGRAV